ncbi:M3 family oligoendopeptidase [Sutcliffiella horikoshii]|uniref:M3 family oligoendopeptidase n=1 Tax=Sutcliffiella horikoshii TaxID=79883 RepID=UPI001F3CAADE|nr:M3 family oligoendopeptidase [Sutcliffiella horikoshii]MCG1023229.1 M3 family oligoendopeptidase [Sutcliffiella horikoshii]
MNQIKYQKRWDLESLFMGGSDSASFLLHIKQLENKISEWEVMIFPTLKTVDDAYEIAEILGFIGEVRAELSQASSFITCLLAQNTTDQQAQLLRGQISTLQARYDVVIQQIQNNLVKIKPDLWTKLLETEELKGFKYILTKWREHSEAQLSSEAQKLYSALSLDGYHGWGQLYQSFISTIKVKVKLGESEKEFSVGQAINLRSHHDEAVRKEAHFALEVKWDETKDHFAKILNHIAGFRLQVYQNRGLKNVLEEPLMKNRIKPETLDTMWSAVSKAKEPFISYLNQKAKIQGTPKMRSYNFWAPMSVVNKEIRFEEAVGDIIEQFSSFGPELEALTKRAVAENWIEAENRVNKSPIAFCASFPMSGESRIFMTFGGSMGNVLTLAHELGHAYHNHAMGSVNGLNKQYPMSIAETASTFCELIFLDAAIQKAQSDEEKLTLLDEKLKRSVMNFMNIHSRFIFEKRFYEEREQGIVSSERLNQLMKESINDGYCSSVDHSSIHSWIWTPHFYNTKEPFYNFPYTFGYLFALSIYAKWKEVGAEFEKDFINLLRDSGSMSTEDLVMKHLGEDITLTSFWEKGIQICLKDVEEFNMISNFINR